MTALCESFDVVVRPCHQTEGSAGLHCMSNHLGCGRREDALEAVQQGASNLLTGREVLSAGLLETTRLKDANMQEPSKAAVQTLQFHPDGKLLFTGGLDKSLRFFQVYLPLPRFQTPNPESRVQEQPSSITARCRIVLDRCRHSLKPHPAYGACP